MSQRITGIFNIMATPFDSALQVDWDSLRHLVNFQLDKDAYGLTILGVLGEAAKLSIDERKQVVDTVMDTVAGRVPVVVGVSHPEVKTVISLSQAAFASGAAGVMIAPPRMDNPTDDKVLAIYSEIAASIDQPIVVQDFPPVNGVFMSADFLAALAEQIPNARHLKLEDPPLMEKIGAIRARTDKYEIFGGLGGMFLLEELNRGASGTMTGFAFTEILVAIFRTFTDGRKQEAERIFDKYLPLIRYENQPVINLTIRKELLKRRGAIADARLRDPFAPIDAGTHAEIDWIFQRVGISDPAQKITF
ncbi:MAG: dihydrodipicolinate synthase family protein [Burkholderiales bacterium]|nr:dihydrodipicolinate synthase family protein [Anaerolineae bacterium]